MSQQELRRLITETKYTKKGNYVTRSKTVILVSNHSNIDNW